MLFGFVEGDDFGVVKQVVLVPTFTHNLAGTIEDDTADGGVGGTDPNAPARKFKGALHPVDVFF